MSRSAAAAENLSLPPSSSAALVGCRLGAWHAHQCRQTVTIAGGLGPAAMHSSMKSQTTSNIRLVMTFSAWCLLCIASIFLGLITI